MAVRDGVQVGDFATTSMPLLFILCEKKDVSRVVRRWSETKNITCVASCVASCVACFEPKLQPREHVLVSTSS